MTHLRPLDLNRAPSLSPRGDAFADALLSGGDGRIRPDDATGLNKYLCPPRPSPSTACLSSCTASPISDAGFADASACHRDIAGAATPHRAAERAEAWQARVEAAVLSWFGAESLADVRLLPSGTDAVLWTASALAREAGGRPMTAILPAAAETGTGVPLAASCRGFDPGPAFGRRLAEADVDAVEAPLRGADGAALGDDELDAVFARAAAGARGHPVVYLTCGTKTGLVAPLEPPPGAEVVVDACQARLSPDAMRGFLRRGWPVAVTGSKMLGGPAFSGAVLVPKGRLPLDGAPPAIGPLLRWVAALDGLTAFAAAGDGLHGRLARRADEIAAALARLPGVEAVPGPSRGMVEASGWPATILTFAVHGRAGRLTADELRPIHRSLAARGVLVGQPVGLGAFGGLRLAVSARDAANGFGDRLDRFAEAFRAVAAAQVS